MNKKIMIICLIVILCLGLGLGIFLLKNDYTDSKKKTRSASKATGKSREEVVIEEVSNSPLKDLSELKINEDLSISLSMIPAGTFLMGSYEGIGGEDELPVRNVTISKCYLMGTYEITQKEWESVMGDNPSSHKGDNLPVENITFKEAMDFCQKLSDLSGYQVSLPTEAQWEYACRGGSEDLWFFGNDDSMYGTYSGSSEADSTYEVGLYQPNPNGLYDLYGNVMEWCLDYYNMEYDEEDLVDPLDERKNISRVIRGGGWGGSPDECRSGYRNASGEEVATDGIGLRIVVIS